MADEHSPQRRYPRVCSENALLVTRVGVAESEIEGLAKTRVVGLGGCMFLADESMGVGSALEMLISVRGQIAKAHGRVVYELPTDDLQFEVGVEFVGISDPDRSVIEMLFAAREGTA